MIRAEYYPRGLDANKTRTVAECTRKGAGARVRDQIPAGVYAREGKCGNDNAGATMDSRLHENDRGGGDFQ